jgi:large subunit ribosomal protein L30e
MDVNRALRSAAQTGTVVLGLKESLAAVSGKKAKLLVVAENAPKAGSDQIAAAAQKNGVPIYRFKGPNTELGPAAGKPFSVAVLAVLEPGESDVLQLARGSE